MTGPDTTNATLRELALVVDRTVTSRLPWAAGRPLATLDDAEERELYLTTLAAVHEARALLDEYAADVVLLARRANASWREVGERYGMGDEGARKRWA